MGAFYTNVALKGVDAERLRDYLAERNRPAFIAPAQDGVTLLYDGPSEDQDLDVMHDLLRKVSRDLDCPALGSLVHDSDILVQLLYERGTLKGSYCSAPRYFGPDSGLEAAPSAELWRRTWGGVAPAWKLWWAWHRPVWIDRILLAFYLLAVAPLLPKNLRQRGMTFFDGVVVEGKHRRVCLCLGIPEAAVSFGYKYLKQGERPKRQGQELSLLEVDPMVRIWPFR